jgi:NSS family neurotransmitter:Na+ symporter
VFASGLDPAAGPGLVFVTLPVAFAGMPFGTLAAIAFFALLAVAALASAISMLEIGVRIVMRRLRWSRPRSTVVLASACFLVGLASVLSFNRWAHWYPLEAVAPFARSTFFDLLDYATSNVLLPIAGCALAIFAGWVIPISELTRELRLRRRGARLLGWLLRYLVPVAIVGATLAPVLLG